MKVVGQTNDGFLVEASKTEIANILGFTRWEDLYNSGEVTTPYYGAEYVLAPVWTKITSLGKNRGRMVDAANKLRDSAKTVTDYLQAAALALDEANGSYQSMCDCNTVVDEDLKLDTSERNILRDELLRSKPVEALDPVDEEEEDEDEEVDYS